MNFIRFHSILSVMVYSVSQTKNFSRSQVSYDSMFLQDDRRGTYFPQDDGTFDTVEMVDRVSYEVCGDSTDENSHSTTPQMPQTQSAYSSTNSVDSIRQRTVFGPRILSGTGGSRSNNSPLPSRSRQYNQSATYSSSQSAASPVEEREISRCVYLGEFDSNSVPNIIGSIYLKLKESQCSVWKVCEALRGSGQCHFENLTLVDAKGFEIQESDETSGKTHSCSLFPPFSGFYPGSLSFQDTGLCHSNSKITTQNPEEFMKCIPINQQNFPKIISRNPEMPKQLTNK